MEKIMNLVAEAIEVIEMLFDYEPDDSYNDNIEGDYLRESSGPEVNGFLTTLGRICSLDRKKDAEIYAYAFRMAANCIRNNLGVDEAAAFLAVVSTGKFYRNYGNYGKRLDFFGASRKKAAKSFERVRKDYLDGNSVPMKIIMGSSSVKTGYDGERFVCREERSEHEVPLVGGRSFSEHFKDRAFEPILKVYESVRGPKREFARIQRVLDELGDTGDKRINALLARVRWALCEEELEVSIKGLWE